MTAAPAFRVDADGIASLVAGDPERWEALGQVAALGLPQGCIGAGFLRNLVWDRLHGRESDCRGEDLDVLYFDPGCLDPEQDRGIEARLRAAAPGLDWSVKNQARMHLRNGDPPYGSVADAMRHWPETATAVAAWRERAQCRLLAPFGLDDLAGMILRPTPAFRERLAVFDDRLRQKDWQRRWPHLRIVGQAGRGTTGPDAGGTLSGN